jgi:hypothetical protein
MPDTIGNRRIDDLDDRLTAPFLGDRLKFWLHSKPYASAFDNNRFTAFGGVEK